MKLTRGQIIAIILCALPLILLGYNFFSNQLSANPIQVITQRTGRTSIFLLLLSLLCTPMRNLFGLTALMPIRKSLGLFAFFYALLHFLVFLVLDFQLNWQWVWQEVQHKLFLQIGIVGLLILLVLAITSLKSFQRILGKSWSKIHKLVYSAVAFVIIHIFLSVKGDFFFPIQLSIIFVILMSLRISPFGNWQLQRKPDWLQAVNQYLLH